MRKLFLFLLLVPSIAYCADKITPFKGASYKVIEGKKDSITGGIPTDSKYATYFTYDGQEVGKLDNPVQNMNKLDQMLDPKAPKPQPTTYAIKYWPAIQLGFGMTKGAPGYFIVFSDKHGNTIESYRYDTNSQKISVYNQMQQTLEKVNSIAEIKDLDTTIVQEFGSDPLDEHKKY